MKHVLLTVLSLAMTFPAISMAQTEAASQSWVVALKPDKDPEAMLSERKQLEEYLSKELKGSVKVIVPLSASVIQEGLANGSIDLAYLSGTDMVMARERGTADLFLAAKIDGKTSYESLWLVAKENTAKNIGDLQGKPVAFASRTSTSGFLVPVADLVRSKKLKSKDSPEIYFGKGNVLYGTGYVSAIEKVFQGQAEAAAVSDYVFLKDKHLNAEQKARLRILQKQGPVPTHVLAISKKTPTDRRATLEAALLKMNSGSNAALRDKLFNSELVKVDADKHLRATVENFELTGIKL